MSERALIFFWNKKQELEELRNRCTQLEKKVHSYDSAMDDIRLKITEFETEMDEARTDETRHREEMAPLQARISEIKAEISQTQSRIREIDNEEKEMRRSMSQHKQSSAEFASRIEAETRRIESDTG